jgi:hypothetical protein
MRAQIRHLLHGVAAGVGATLTMDLTSALGRVLGLTRGAAPEWLARWFALVLSGHLVSHDIRTDPVTPVPLPLLLALHYAIGVVLALFYRRVVGARGSVATALAFGLATNALPWLIMFPAMGFGWFGLAGPAEHHLLRSSLVGHLAYGLGLALTLHLRRDRTRGLPGPASPAGPEQGGLLQ